MKNTLKKMIAVLLALSCIALLPITHAMADGESLKVYTFEAENTDLRGKHGPGASGEASGTSMASTSNNPDVSGENHGFVTYLYQEGVSVNFVIKSEEDVENVQLIIRLGIESMDYYFDPSTYLIQIDSCSEEDLKSVDDSGAVGNWDAFFLDYYGPNGDGKDDPDHVRYTIDKWTCGEIHLDGTGSNTPIGFADFVITKSLSLSKGYTCISLITANSDFPVNNQGVEMAGTYAAVAPCVDCIKLITTATLDMAVTYNNGCGTVAMTVADAE